MPDDATTELRPCPFCGGTDVKLSDTTASRWRGPYPNPAPIWVVRCLDCTADGPARLTEAEAVAAWDRRPETEAGRA